MATRAERKQRMEQYSDTNWEELAHRLGDVRLEVAPEKRIKEILNAADRSGTGDEYDRALGLPTDAEQQLQLQRDGLETSKSAVHAAWISAGCAIMAIVIAIIALVVALGESG